MRFYGRLATDYGYKIEGEAYPPVGNRLAFQSLPVAKARFTRAVDESHVDSGVKEALFVSGRLTFGVGDKEKRMAAETTEERIPIDLPRSLNATRHGAIAHLRLARVEKRNALDDATVLGLETFFTRLPNDIRAVVLTGEGAHFSAGLDLSEVAGERDPLEGVLHSRMWHRAFEAIQFGRAPVIAVLHGAVVGGGLELAASTHIRIAERSAYYGLPEGQRGIFLGGGGSVRVARLIGVARVQDMMLTGRTLTAEEGHLAGATQYLVEDGKGLETAMSLAGKAASNTSTTNFAVLHALPRIFESDPASGLLTESLMASIAEMSSEAKLRLKDFLEKRAAKVLRQS
jgi:(methylthio)acryloyl-CoA hydratase